MIVLAFLVLRLDGAHAAGILHVLLLGFLMSALRLTCVYINRERAHVYLI